MIEDNWWWDSRSRDNLTPLSRLAISIAMLLVFAHSLFYDLTITVHFEWSIWVVITAGIDLLLLVLAALWAIHNWRCFRAGKARS